MVKPNDYLERQAAASNKGGNERRVHVRYRVSLPVYIRMSTGELAKTVAVDISSGGIYIEYGASAEEGKVFDMLFDLPFDEDFQRVYVKAKVVRSVIIGNRDVYGIAFSFVEFARDTDQVLKKYLELRSLKQLV